MTRAWWFGPLAAAFHVGAQAQPAADWRVNIEISWSRTPPTHGTLQTPAGGIDFPIKSQSLPVSYPAANGLEDYRLVIHYPEFAHTFAVFTRKAQQP